MSARWLKPFDDVATAIVDLPAGATVHLASGNVTKDVTLVEPIAMGHKFAVRALAKGLRIRKYGELIGRMSRDVPAGGWVHVDHLETSARHSAAHEAAWYDRVETATVLEAFGPTRTKVGENPLYDAAQDRFYWIDVRDTPAIFCRTLATGEEHQWPLREDIGSIALMEGTRLLACLRSGFAMFDTADGTMTPLIDPEPHLPGNRLNDGKCDPQGRYWCGSINPETGTADGSLYVLERDLTVRHVLPDFLTPNGMTWSLDGKTLYLADTRRGLIRAHDFDGEHGTLGATRVFADLGAMPGGPDGATLDTDGYLWWAQFDGACLVRYAPDGSMDRVVRLPVSRPTSCAFGGPGFRHLYVTTGTRGFDAAAFAREPLAGRVLKIDVGIGGFAPVPFVPLPEALARETLTEERSP
ncbi:MAG: SMP-30/gluconolactonase/LRE family protein [Proteobacteria bacterium]|nr:SMP-30/gluconolactonase/LRE family protein [Pseudomonadota bacterium]